MHTRVDEFTYPLPPELIAQEPAERRDNSRLMVLDRKTETISHERFASIGDHLRPPDMLVANRTRVMPARIMARKETGAAVELLLLRGVGDNSWIALARPSRRLRMGTHLSVPDVPLTITLKERMDEGQWIVVFDGRGDIETLIREAGQLPLPPYIRSRAAPAERYQTVYADREGSVAAPTAGLHFTPELLSSLRSRGIGVQYATLHVGLGTFKPVTVDHVEEHRMHAEWGEVPREVAQEINAARARGGRVIAVGTTTTRLLESAYLNGIVHPFSGETDRFIFPGYEFRALDGLVTNFHLPRSTLLMLVSAFAGHDFVMHAYKEAVRLRYRFFSFGDAMLIL